MLQDLKSAVTEKTKLSIVCENDVLPSDSLLFVYRGFIIGSQYWTDCFYFENKSHPSPYPGDE